MHVVAVLLLLVNGVFDVFSGGCTLFNVPLLNIMHASCWKNGEDHNNRTAARFMAYLIFVVGSMRLASAAGAGLWWACASYVIEGVVFAAETLFFGTMHTGEGTAVAVASFLLFFCYSFLVTP